MRTIMLAAALAATALLSGCYVAPGYGGGYYAEPAPVYVGPSYYYGPRYHYWHGGGYGYGGHGGHHHHWH